MPITLEEVKQAIAEQEAAREKALAQANFHTGFLTALRQIEERLKADQDPADFPEAIEVDAKQEIGSANKNERKSK